ncbi:lysozyme inhibitor LprI family protein [Methylobacterium fujisawaense]|uniref:lysozyme inhibitor LprI family protein n=1 Tax=Methylobacterium fujisawaense TaxID=107400 RepID=UPI00313EEAAA
MTVSSESRTRFVRLCGGLALASTLLSPVPAAAADPCEGTTQADLNACAGADYRTADTALNAVYGQLMKKVGPKTKDALRGAQKAWLSYRDATCFLETMGFDGGSAYAMEYNGCLKGLTDARTKILKGYLDCKPDNVSCVGRLGE